MRRSPSLGLGVLFVLLAACSRKVEPPPPPAPPPPPPKPIVHVPLERAADLREGSAVVLAKHGSQPIAFVADEDDHAIRAIDLTSKAELSTTPIEGRPSQMIIDKQGRLLVALRDDQAVQVFEATDDRSAPLDATGRIPTAVEPIGLAITPDDATLLVTSGWGHALEGFGLAEPHARTLAVDLAREPRSIVVSSDGKTAYIAHAMANQVSTIDLEDAKNTKVAAIELGLPGWTEVRRGPRFQPFMLDFKLEVDPLDDFEPRHFHCGMVSRRRVTFPPRFARQGFAIAMIKTEKAEHILAPHMAVATGDATVISSGYGGGGLAEEENVPSEMFDIDVIDVAKGKKATGSKPASFHVRFGKDACRLPRAAVVDTAKSALFVSCLGVDKVVEYDASGTTPVAGFKRSFTVPSGPTALALDRESRRLLVWSSFDRTLSSLSLEAKDDRFAITIAAKSPLAADLAQGRKLFHAAANPKISRDGRACASCHPEGRDDGLVWSTPNGPRQTIMLAGRVSRDAPFGWLGKHASIKEHVTITMKNLSGTGLDDQELGALTAWLRAMPPPPKEKGKARSPKEERGRELFASSQLQCNTCHTDKTDFSDREAHDVGSATIADTNRQFLAPSLRFVGGSAPYFHDGRYATLAQLLEKNDKMGDTKSLSSEDRDALEAYLRTL